MDVQTLQDLAPVIIYPREAVPSKVTRGEHLRKSRFFLEFVCCVDPRLMHHRSGVNKMVVPTERAEIKRGMERFIRSSKLLILVAGSSYAPCLHGMKRGNGVLVLNLVRSLSLRAIALQPRIAAENGSKNTGERELIQPQGYTAVRVYRLYYSWRLSERIEFDMMVLTMQAEHAYTGEPPLVWSPSDRYPFLGVERDQRSPRSAQTLFNWADAILF